MIKTDFDNVQPYLAKAGQLIRELMHPNPHGNFRQSPAEAMTPPNTATLLHKHIRTEKIYRITDRRNRINSALYDAQFHSKARDPSSH